MATASVTATVKELEDEGPGEEFGKAELIVSGEYTRAMEGDYHAEHLSCHSCSKSLTGHRYVLRDENPFCISCYEDQFANKCDECNNVVGIDSKDLSYQDKHWHEKCFFCASCKGSLVDKPFAQKEAKLFCADCHDENFAARCDGCTKPFRAGMKKFEYKGQQWHDECFLCAVCQQPIGNASFVPKEDGYVCVPCFESHFAQKCTKCGGVINKGGVTYKNTPFHRECFTCTNCEKQLAGEKFTSKEEKPYCADCYADVFAKKCVRCEKAISGFGGTKFIAFEEKQWHSDCFLCSKCDASMVGRGFLMDGESVVCPECGRA